MVSTTNEAVLTAMSARVLTVTLNRPRQQNALSDMVVDRLHAAIDMAEQSPGCRMVVIRGVRGVFCTGMDLEEEAGAAIGGGDSGPRGARFFGLLRRFVSTPRVVVSAVDGRVAGGGVGLVAASDFVFSSERAQFSLPEALWGLLPCVVVPFLVRRIGFRVPYTMTLSTLPINARKAERLGLVDEACDDIEVPLRRLANRVTRLQTATLAAAKGYFGQLWPIDEAVEATALGQLDRLLSSPFVRRALADFTGPKKSFPWER